MKVTLVTAASVLPVSLAEAKSHMRVDFTTDDGYIQGLIMSSTFYVEEILRRKLITQTWKLFMDKWPGGNYYELPYGQLQSVTHVKYTDSDDTVITTFDEDDEWTADTDSDPGRVVLKYGEVWPGDTLAIENPIETQFVCGYGAHTAQTITGATNTTPIVITIVGHERVSGARMLIADIVGNTNANGLWIIEKVNDDTFKLLGSSGNADYTSGASIATVGNTDVDTGTENIDTFADTIGDGVYWDYVVKKTTNLRAGRITATWDATGNTVEFNEVSTSDVGDTSDVTFSVDINADLVRLRCTVTSDDWNVTGIRTVIAAGTGNYTSGGTATEISVPEAIRQAIKILAADMYENREEHLISAGKIVSTSALKTADNLLWPYRLFGF